MPRKSSKKISSIKAKKAPVKAPVKAISKKAMKKKTALAAATPATASLPVVS
jgi:hypothetical protein